MQAGDSTFCATLPVLAELIENAEGDWLVKSDLRSGPDRRTVYGPGGTYFGCHKPDEADYLLSLLRGERVPRWVPEAMVMGVLDALATKLHAVPDGRLIARWERTVQNGHVTFATRSGQTTIRELPVEDTEPCLGHVRQAFQRTAAA